MTQNQITLFKAQPFYLAWERNYYLVNHELGRDMDMTVDKYLEEIDYREILRGAFSWEKSPEGLQYWSEQHDSFTPRMERHEELETLFKSQVWYPCWLKNNRELSSASAETILTRLPETWIERAFSWGRSEEGEDFWRTINRLWYEKVKGIV